MPDETIRNLLARDLEPGEYEAIRREWKIHSIAEDNRDIAGLLSTLTPDCIYEVVPFGVTWEGHAGAERFYTELLTAFPDVHFDLTHIVIGPQGVWEEASVTATHKQRWLGFEPTGERLEFGVQILFPWDRERRKFRGERVHLDPTLLG